LDATQLYDVMVEDGTLSDTQKARIAAKLAEVDKCLLDGADEELQLLSLLALVRNTLAP
jgi:replication factor C subunit 2/4